MGGYVNITRAFDVLRSEPGMNNSSSCMEQLSWLLLLKFIDELHACLPEQLNNSDIYGIAPEFQWRAWAKTGYGGGQFDWDSRGREFLNFVDDELFPYMRSLNWRHEKGTLLANVGVVFTLLNNRITSTRVLVSVLQMVDEIEFSHVDEFGEIFDKLAQELSSSATGYVQTPAALVRALIEVTAPDKDAAIYDPAAGTGRFLIEAAMFIRQGERFPTRSQLKKDAGFLILER
jgi:type I restriction enzyme M protein